MGTIRVAILAGASAIRVAGYAGIVRQAADVGVSRPLKTKNLYPETTAPLLGELQPRDTRTSGLAAPVTAYTLMLANEDVVELSRPAAALAL
jgi:hypothetical protein